ncbi:MAG: TlpA family protein disulfide reductase [Gemmatimonadaceae bacterium]|nr:TlpA family protein disulfide reductase [Gemmatimonadaceae bacterium]
MNSTWCTSARALCFALLVFQASSVAAQDGPPASVSGSPSECLKASRDWYSQASTAVWRQGSRAKNLTVALDSLLREARIRATPCAQAQRLDDQPLTELSALAQLYQLVERPLDAARTATVFMASSGVPDTAKFTFLSTLIRGNLQVDDSASVSRNDAYFALMDALSDAVLRQRVAMHAGLSERYRSSDVNRGIRTHAEALIAIRRRLQTSKPDSAVAIANAAGLKGGMLASAYGHLADVLGDDGYADSAIVVLRSGLAENPEFSPVEKAPLEKSIARFSLVGKRAAPIDGTQWINAPPTTARLSPKGKVTVIGFTAHWCPPCVKSYPDFVALHETLKSDAVQFVLNTEFYGFVGERQNLTMAQEVEASRAYYVGKQRIRFPVAIAGRTPTRELKFADLPHVNFENYHVSWIPTTFIVDQQGTIRRILTGWDAGNKDRILKQVRALLEESAR